MTTPESLYILLGSESGRRMLRTTRTVIVDEIHAVAPNKRGAHLALSLERLAELCGGQLLRVGLSATQKPIEAVARFLIGARSETEPAGECAIIDVGHRRARDLALEVPSAPLEAVMSADVWQQVYDRLAELTLAHRTTLIFVNTRRMAERVTRALSDRLGEQHVSAHHGSLAKELRLDAEQRLKGGALKALVATASLELGIDIGEVDLVCQLGSPRRIASFLQRVGRSGHAVDGTPKGRLFPLSRDDLVECAALLDAVARGELDRLAVPEQPLDVLAQQITAEVAAREWQEDELYALVRRAWPFRALARADFAAVVGMLAQGFSTRRGRRGALIHHDAVNHVLRGRRGARLSALTNAGTIPDNADYRVILEPEDQFVGTVNEDFAVESLPGDVFQLGNSSYRIMRVERGTVRVEDARGMPPTIPFWLGEAPGRSDELSLAVSRLRAEIAGRLANDPAGGSALRWLMEEVGLDEAAATQLVDYLAAAHAALGCLPTQDTLVLERFFDEAGGMQLVIHSPRGSRLNRAWGLALRKRFCRKFNFELQAAATEDNIVLSLTTAHSFELAEVTRYLHSASVRPLLIQALLDAPMFITRWRWVGGVALALPRFRGGRKVAPQLARMEAEDLIAAVFPDQLACAREPRRRARDPRSPAGRADHRRLPPRRHGHRRPGGAAAPPRGGRDPRHGARSHRALAAGARGALRPTLRLSRRRAAGGAPHPGRDEPALAGARGSRRPRPARSRRDRARALRSLARARERRRAPRRPGLARVPQRGGGTGGAELGRLAGGAGARSTCDATAGAIGDALGRRRAPAAVPGALAGSEARAGYRCPGGARGARLVAGRGVGRDPARPARRPGAGHGERAGGAARARARRHRGRACGASDRGLRHARALHAGSGRWTNGASAGCSPASTTTRSSVCAPRSSRSPRAISCASCFAGNGSRPTRACKGPMPSR